MAEIKKLDKKEVVSAFWRWTFFSHANYNYERLEATGLVAGIPIFALGIPAVLSLYFDLFSGFVQALVFSLLSMVYISGSLPEEPEAAAVEA